MFHFSYSSFLQTCTALSPDEQLSILKDTQNKKNNNNETMSNEDWEIIQYYLNEVR